MTQSLLELGDGTGCVAFVGENGSERLMGVRVPQGCFELRCDLVELLGRLPCLSHVVARQRDLDLRRQQACPHQRQRLVGKGRPDR